MCTVPVATTTEAGSARPDASLVEAFSFARRLTRHSGKRPLLSDNPEVAASVICYFLLSWLRQAHSVRNVFPCLTTRHRCRPPQVVFARSLLAPLHVIALNQWSGLMDSWQ